ncbi:MAG TPA: 50S ribosomal protein L4 [Candidatus Woesearchaeota archaeon]|nr:50S ribosomal protein L4 [Candidatus Woesearchaeota archaeon]
MKAILKSAAGTTKGTINLPVQFEEEIRPDLIKRAVLAVQSHKYQPQGTDIEAGKKYSSKLSRRRRDYKTSYGYGISRVPRKILSYRGTRFNWQGATSPNTVGGRQSHPPKSEKIIYRKINKKERRKAIRSAMAASVQKELVLKRGHYVEEYPLVLEDSIENLKQTKDVLSLLKKLKMEKELERAAKKTRKTGNARRRGRKSKRRKGPLFVVSKKCDLVKAASNIPGVNVVEIESLNAELLAPGCEIGRLTFYTKSAVEKLEKLNLFIDSRVEKKPEEKKTRGKQEIKVEQKKKQPKVTKK